jgi:hypothetical protein
MRAHSLAIAENVPLPMALLRMQLLRRYRRLA